MLALYADHAGLLADFNSDINSVLPVTTYGPWVGLGKLPCSPARLAKEAAILRLLPQISLIAVPTQGVYKTLPGCIVHENNGASTNANKVPTTKNKHTNRDRTINKVQQRQVNEVGYRSIIWTLANTYYLHCRFDHPHNSIDMLQLL